MTTDLKELKKIRYSICVSGAAAGPTVKGAHDSAVILGEQIAREGHILTSGATVGLPYFAAYGAKKEGGTSIGFSPASSLREHVRKYRLPHDVFDFINFTGMDYVGRDLYLVQSSDAVITVGGRFGSLHEFTSALEARKPCGILLGSGGTADLIPELMKTLSPPAGDIVIYDEDPIRLVQRLVAILDIKYEDIRNQLERDEHWYLKEGMQDAIPTDNRRG
jgi:uncharacterized protein (TIGR00725 family)